MKPSSASSGVWGAAIVTLGQPQCNSEIYSDIEIGLIALKTQRGKNMKPATVSSRFLGEAIDTVILFALSFTVLMLANLVFSEATMFRRLLNLSLSTVIALVYHCYFESSPAQATPGMRCRKIRICTAEGFKRISFLNAFGRYLSCVLVSAWLGFPFKQIAEEKYIFGVIILFSMGLFVQFLPYLSMFFTAKKQTLFDILSQVMVVQEQPQEEPVTVVVQETSAEPPVE